MVEMESECERVGGVTLVTGVLAAGDRAGPVRVRVAAAVDGPVWPPRRRGLPEPGWDADGFETVLAAGERAPFGFATPAPVDGPAVEVVGTEPAEDDAPGPPEAGSRTAGGPDEDRVRETVQRLRSPRVPRDAVPTPAADGEPGGDGADRVDPEAGEASRPPEATDRPDASGADLADASLLVPGHVRRWLDDAAARVERLADGQGGGNGDTADPADHPGSLGCAVAADRRALAAVAERASALADRAAEVER